jgi:hypothetical protein
MNTGRSQRGNIPRGVSQIVAILAPVMIGLVVHGMHVSQLGLYWDDADQFMQGLQAADGNMIRFILSDTFGYLHAERPVAHVLMMIHRAAFAMSLSTLHWSLVVLLILNAIMLETIIASIIKETWIVFAAGLLFLTYPLSPLQAIWPATAPYLWACLLALLTILCSWYGLGAPDGRRLKWFALAAFTYMASLLTHEGFALLPLAFMSLCVVSKDGQNTAAWCHLGRISLYKPAMWGLCLLASLFGVYGLWRILILPLYGTYVYPSAQIGPDPTMLANHVLGWMKMVFIPWVPVWGRIDMSPPPFTYVLWSAGLFVVTWVITLELLRHSPAQDYPSHGRSVQIPGRDSWVQAAMIGTALVIAALVAIGVSPVSVSMDFGVDFPRTSSRVNFIATVGIALALPALLALLLRFYHRYPVLSGLVALVGLLYAGFMRWGKIFAHGVLLSAYVLVVILVMTMMLLALIRPKQKGMEHRATDGMAAMMPQGGAYVLSGAMACMVFLGTLFHWSIKEELATEWRRHTTMLEELRTLAPAVKDDTFIVIVHRPGRSRSAPYSAHGELSDYFLALYANWTIMGNRDQHLRFYADGVESINYGTVATWFPPGVKGPAMTYATVPFPHIAYDRLLLFAFDGSTLRLLPQMEVTTIQGEVLVVQNNPGRIVPRMTPRTAVWRHVTGY